MLAKPKLHAAVYRRRRRTGTVRQRPRRRDPVMSGQRRLIWNQISDLAEMPRSRNRCLRRRPESLIAYGGAGLPRRSRRTRQGRIQRAKSRESIPANRHRPATADSFFVLGAMGLILLIAIAVCFTFVQRRWRDRGSKKITAQADSTPGPNAHCSYSGAAKKASSAGRRSAIQLAARPRKAQVKERPTGASSRAAASS